MEKVLIGHTSPETAYVVEDYPYGFTLRCRIRYWIETRPKFGQRLVSQTTNPKKAGEVWNKPKAGTYHSILVMGLDENDHVTSTAIQFGADKESLDKWAGKYGFALTPDQVKTLEMGYKLAQIFADRYATFQANVNARIESETPP